MKTVIIKSKLKNAHGIMYFSEWAKGVKRDGIQLPSSGYPVNYFNGKIGTYTMVGTAQPSSLFLIKGSSKGATVVPINPNKY